MQWSTVCQRQSVEAAVFSLQMFPVSVEGSAFVPNRKSDSMVAAFQLCMRFRMSGSPQGYSLPSDPEAACSVHDFDSLQRIYLRNNSIEGCLKMFAAVGVVS